MNGLSDLFQISDYLGGTPDGHVKSDRIPFLDVLQSLLKVLKFNTRINVI